MMPARAVNARLDREADAGRVTGRLEALVRRSPLFVVFLTVVIDLLGFGIVLPLLPLYADEHGASPATIGLLFTAFSGVQFVTSPLWGRLSDRIGRRPVILLGLTGSIASYALFGIAEMLPNPLVWLFASRIAAGLFGGTIGAAYATIADVTSERERGRGMALIGMAFGIGFTLGPAIGGLGHALHPTAPGLIAATCSTAALLFAWRRFEEPAHRRPTTRGTWLDLGALRESLARPNVRVLLLAIFVTVTCFALFESTLGLLAKRVYSFGVQQVGWLFTYLGFWIALTQGVIVRRLMPRVGEVRLARAGCVMLAAGLVLLSLDLTVAYLAAVAPIVVLGFGMVVPSINALLSRRTDADRQGGMMGLAQSLQSLARIVGPLAGLSMFGVAWALPFRVGAAGMVAAALLALAFRSPRTEAEGGPLEPETA